ncbi:hypothetical protein [Rhizobium herbae]|uniref:Uncharacterized protein n=1 Tax=Rhizobium herbae TaxID=508661 RepID=A0ABS4EP93_9HYPH|nr:hypothetical protein [Rhizobium herbae]MBP1859760.1 hypothetical protein [Rhizobium herbae]
MLDDGRRNAARFHVGGFCRKGTAPVPHGKRNVNHVAVLSPYHSAMIGRVDITIVDANVFSALASLIVAPSMTFEDVPADFA